jgi:drug/metabolite transporter (DMT)-like permease
LDQIFDWIIMRGKSSYQSGLLLVFGSAIVWSFGGALARFLTIEDSWTIVFWRSVWATAFLVAFLVYRDGFGGTLTQVRRLRWPAFLVAICFCTA